MTQYKCLALPLLLAIPSIAALTSCEDTPDIGNSLVEDETEVVKVSDFTVVGRTVGNTSVETRNLVEMLGRIDADGYGKLSAEFVTQLMPAAQLSSTLTRDNVDSIRIEFYIIMEHMWATLSPRWDLRYTNSTDSFLPISTVSLTSQSIMIRPT